VSAPIIQADYEQLAQIIKFIHSQADAVEKSKKKLASTKENLQGGHWIGGGAHAFYTEFEQDVMPALSRLVEILNLTAQEVGNISQILKDAEDEAAASFQDQEQASIFIPFFPSSFFSDIKKSAFEKGFNERWRSMSIDEREQVLQECYNRLVRQYDLIPRPINYPDLPDKVSLGITIRDSKGFYDASQIAIDIDNLKSSNGRDTLNTLLHEARHQIQHKLVEDYQTMGNQMLLPAGVTLDQVISWDENMRPENYVKWDDSFKGYLGQPIEVDARRFAEENINRYAQEASWISV
jgi:WXG100 family type VII secretion target